MVIRYFCYKCKVQLESEDALGGLADTCPDCGAICEVPLSKAQETDLRRQEKEVEAILAEDERKEKAQKKRDEHLQSIVARDAAKLFSTMSRHIVAVAIVLAALLLVFRWKELQRDPKLVYIPAGAIGAIAVAVSALTTHLRVRRNAAMTDLNAGWRQLKEEQERLLRKEEEQGSQLRQAKERNEQDLREARERQQAEIAASRERCHHDRKALDALVAEKTRGFPWLAEAYAEYSHSLQLQVAKQLEEKSPPAPKAAEVVRKMAEARRAVEKNLHVARGIFKYWISLFPFLEDVIGDDIDDDVLRRILKQDVARPIYDLSGLNVDPVRLLLRLSQEDFDALSTAERNQLALDRWKRKPKSKWQVGRDYERYIGYLHEREGYAVWYQGILEGYEDLGRDLIAKRSGRTLVIQCKKWSQYKTIHEKHVNQLFGTVTKYKIDHRRENVQGVLYVTNELSPLAREFATHLGIAVYSSFPYDDQYPIIKCNVSRATGEKIYHLPFDQQYDTTVIEPERGECYVAAVAEAEALGFRRAWRWHPQNEEG